MQAMIQMLQCSSPTSFGRNHTWVMPMMTAQNPSTDPTLRSMWRVMITSTMPQAMIPMDAV